MPRQRTKMGTEGLLTQLRIAIANNNEDLARDIADLCSRQNNCNARFFNMFVGRVCLEHKYPGDLILFEVLKQRVNSARSNFNETNKTIRFIQVAVAAAKLETSSVPFEKAFIAYHELLSTFKIQKECVLDSNMTIDEYKNSKEVNNVELKFHNKEQYSGIFSATLKTEKRDKFEVVIPDSYEIAEEESLIPYGMYEFSSDMVLKGIWIEKMTDEVETFQDLKVYSQMSQHKIEESDVVIKTKLENNELFQARHKILQGDDASEKVKLLFPKTSDEFQERMTAYIKENKLFFLTKPIPLLAKLRVECRQFYATVSTVTIDNVEYGCRYLKREKTHWVAQLVVPDDAPSNSSQVISTYPRIHQKFSVSFPTFTNEPKKEIIYPEALYKCPWRKIIDFPIGDKTQRWVVTEHVHGMRQMKWKIDLSDPVFCISLLQLLVARYDFEVATTFKDIGVATVNGVMVAVIKNYFGREDPNRKHRDIWHQLLHFTVKTINYRKKRKKGGATEMIQFNTRPEKNYYLNIIKRLKEYLKKHTTEDYKNSTFYKWGKKVYKQKFDDLYLKIISSLGTKEDSNKRQRTDGVVATVEAGINSSVHSSSV